MIRRLLRHRLALPTLFAVGGALLVLAIDPLIRGTQDTVTARTFRIASHLAVATAAGVVLFALFVRLTNSAERYRVLVRGMRDLVFFVSGDGRILDVNQAAAREYGWNRTELIGQPFDSVCVSGEGSPCAVQSVLAGGNSILVEASHRRKDGSRFPVEVRASRSVIARAPVVLVVARDISERQRRNTFEKLLHDIDRKTLGFESLDSNLEFITERLSQLYPQSLVQISLKENDGSVRIRQFAGEGKNFLKGIKVRWDDTPEGRGPTGTAIRTGEIQFSRLEADERFLPWRNRALEQGFKFGVAIPLVAHGVSLGALTIFTRPGILDEAGVEALQGFADQVAISVRSARMVQDLGLQRVALESTANAIVITDAEGIVLWVNPAFTTLTGYAPREILGKTPRLLKSGHHGDAFYRQMWTALKRGEVWRGELYNRRRDGTNYLEEQTITPVRNDDGEITHFVAIKSDITSRRQQEERIDFLAMHDPLTGLANRRLFTEHLGRVVYQARRGRHAAAVIADIDDLKLINDSLGQAAGDQLLRQFAERFRSSLRPGDTIARLGSDEFAALIEGSTLEDAVSAALRLRADLQTSPFSWNGEEVDLSASVGVAAVDGTLEADAVLAHANAAVHAAKELGKDRVIAYHPSIDWSSRLIEEAQWASRIRAALREGGFELVFQPVVNLTTGEADHHEALLRMREADGSLVPPDKFLRVAERFGLMPQIDRWVIAAVIAILRERSGFSVFVNLAAATLEDESVLEFIAESVREHAIPPGRLAFEITETTAITDIAKAQSWIRRVKDLGCLFALDDFGVGFSSLAYLRALPVDYVKIDRSFVADVHIDSTSRALVQAVSTVASTLGKEVIAEGVELEEHAAVLREIGIEHGQGYLWGRPTVDVAPRERVARRDVVNLAATIS